MQVKKVKTKQRREWDMRDKTLLELQEEINENMLKAVPFIKKSGATRLNKYEIEMFQLHNKDMDKLER